ncbi:NTP transferase domain-containing protein [Candidatus Micrarchaeota archaeon]|nr:NTP transferase domain-containing protein [Candidatus Micrarchaeota archaeon]
MERYDFVLLAAGQGKRLQPMTYSYPKSMIRVLQKPLLEWMVEGILETFGDQTNHIVMVVGFEKNKIVDHFRHKPYAKKLKFVEQKEQLGTADALKKAENAISTAFFFVLNGDSFFDPSLYSFLLKSTLEGPFLVAKQEKDASSYGVLIMDESDCLKDLVEKPLKSESNDVNTGTLFLPREFFSELRKVSLSKRKEFELTDALLSYAKRKPLKVVEFPGFWTDVGYFWNFLHANQYALEHLMTEAREGSLEPNVTVKGKLSVAKGAMIKSGTYIEGNAFIGENSVVGPHAYLRKGVVIESNCHVGHSTELKASVVMHNSNAAHLSYIGDSIVCENVNLGAGTMIANLKFDSSSIMITLHGLTIDSKRNKLGSVVGKGTKTGVNASINCGVLVGEDCRIFPGVSVYKNVPNGSQVK